MARSAITALLFLGSCLAVAHGFAVPNAVLNRLTVQRKILDLAANNLEQNPYGIEIITKSIGNLVAGNYLATQWNDVTGAPGQGHTILQITPNGVATPFATVDINNGTVQATCGNFGVGLTMALAILSKGLVIAGSTPLPKGGNGVAGPGCLLLFDPKGNLLDVHTAQEFTTTAGVLTGGGPWAFATQEFNGGSNVNLFVSYVLGSNPASTTTLTGAQGGKVVRYQLQVPGPFLAPGFWGNSPDVIASGFPTQPANIGNGVVGPTGLLLVKDPAHKDRLYIANNLNNSVLATPFPGGCFTRPGGTPQCATNPHVWGGLVNGPIGLTQSPSGSIIGANGGIGTLFEFLPGAFLNNQIADQLVDNMPAAVGAGTLFNVRFLRQNVMIINDDGMNAFFTFTTS